MKISLITTFHNSEEHILDCLNSVRQINDNLDYEHIFVDDGSLDNSRTLILENLSKHQKLIGKEKIGRGRALNLGIKESNGDFVCILDSDDMIEKDWIEFFSRTIIERQEELSQYSVFFGKNLLLRESQYVDFLPAEEQGLNGVESYKLNTQKIYFYNPVSHLGVILRSSSLKDAGYYTEDRKSQFDWDLWFKFLDNKKEFICFNIHTGIKRLHADQSFELKNHFSYTISGIFLQIKYAVKNAKWLIIPVIGFSFLRILWSVIPRNLRFNVFSKL